MFKIVRGRRNKSCKTTQNIGTSADSVAFFFFFLKNKISKTGVGLVRIREFHCTLRWGKKRSSPGMPRVFLSLKRLREKRIPAEPSTAKLNGYFRNVTAALARIPRESDRVIVRGNRSQNFSPAKPSPVTFVIRAQSVPLRRVPSRSKGRVAERSLVCVACSRVFDLDALDDIISTAVTGNACLRHRKTDE